MTNPANIVSITGRLTREPVFFANKDGSQKVKATIAVLVLYYAVGHWNSWVNAMLYIKDRSKYPLQLILREILIENTSNAATQSVGNLSELDQYKQLVKYCTTMIATAPILFIYPFLQKYFVKGVMIGAVKG